MSDNLISFCTKYLLKSLGKRFLQACGQADSGSIFENAIAQQLGITAELSYFQKSNGYEINFILNKTKAIEIKKTGTLADLNTLKNRASTVGLQEYCLISRYEPANSFRDFVWGGNIF